MGNEVKFKFTCTLCGRTSQIIERDLTGFKQMDDSFILSYKCPKCHKQSGQLFYKNVIEKIEGFEKLLRKLGMETTIKE